MPRYKSQEVYAWAIYGVADAVNVQSRLKNKAFPGKQPTD